MSPWTWYTKISTWCTKLKFLLLTDILIILSGFKEDDGLIPVQKVCMQPESNCEKTIRQIPIVRYYMRQTAWTFQKCWCRCQDKIWQGTVHNEKRPREMWQVNAITDTWLTPELKDEKIKQKQNKEKAIKGLIGKIRKCGYELYQIILLY